MEQVIQRHRFLPLWITVYTLPLEWFPSSLQSRTGAVVLGSLSLVSSLQPLSLQSRDSATQLCLLAASFGLCCGWQRQVVIGQVLYLDLTPVTYTQGWVFLFGIHFPANT